VKFEEIKRNNSAFVFTSKMSGFNSYNILNNNAKSPTDKLVLIGGVFGSVILEKSILKLALTKDFRPIKASCNNLGMDYR